MAPPAIAGGVFCLWYAAAGRSPGEFGFSQSRPLFVRVAPHFALIAQLDRAMTEMGST
jgi:hypothetical protein